MQVTSAPRTAARSTAAEPSLRRGSSGAAVTALQKKLAAAGFSAGPADGQFGPLTDAAVKTFQRARGHTPDGAVGLQTWAALDGAGPAPSPAPRPVDDFTPSGKTFVARGTGYFPDSSAIEGGFNDRIGKPLHTLQDFLAGRAPYVSVAMDSTAFPYGTRLRIPELEQKYGRQIDFRVVDTGGAFRGRGTGRIDVCVANARASYDPTVNGTLHLVVQR